LKVEQSFEGDVAILQLSGRVIASPEMYGLRDRIKALIRDGHVNVLVDVSDAITIDSAGLGLLFSAHYTLVREGGCMKVCAPNDRVQGVFYVVLLHKVIDLYPSRAAALSAFAP